MARRSYTYLFGALLAAACLTTGSAPAQTASPARVKQRTIDTVVNADGTYTSTHHSEVQVLNAAIISALAQVPVQYDAHTQDATIGEAYTLKSDGRKLAVSPDTIMTQQVTSGSPLAPIYSDVKRKVLIFPNVEVGDTLVYTYIITAKEPYLPGEYNAAYSFPANLVLDDERITVTLPKSMPLTIDARNVQQSMKTDGDRLVYSFSYSHPQPGAPSTGVLSEPWRLDHVFVSTMKSFDDVAHTFAAVTMPKIRVTPAIQAKADELTQDITDKKLQARALYEWVSQKVRYVAIELGAGGYVPHDAEWTFNNAYGDCKDQAVLLTALMQAKGIKAVPVLINATPQYQLTLPSPGEFNHVIIYLPDYDIYADTTVGNVPFGELPLPDYGKPVLHAVASGATRFSTPLVPEGLLTASYTIRAQITEQGNIELSSDTQATGPWAASLRKAADLMAAAGTAKMADTMLKAKNMPYATGDFTLPPSEGFADAYTIGASLQTQRTRPEVNLMNPLHALRTSSAVGDFLMGPLGNSKITPEDGTPCYSGHESEDLTLELPAGRKLAKLPQDHTVKNANLTYISHWAQNGQTITLHREFTATVKQATCSGALRKAAAAALEQIRDDQSQPVTLAD